MAAAYASADVFVYASETETMGNVILEAMACGCAVVAPRAGGIPSLVTHGETATLYTPGSLQEAVTQTQTLLSDPALRKRMRQAARSTVEGWDWENSIDCVRQAYRQAIENYRPVPMPLTWNQRLAEMVLSSLVFAFRSVSGKGDASRRRDVIPAANGLDPTQGGITAIHTPGPG